MNSTPSLRRFVASSLRRFVASSLRRGIVALSVPGTLVAESLLAVGVLLQFLSLLTCCCSLAIDRSIDRSGVGCWSYQSHE